MNKSKKKYNKSRYSKKKHQIKKHQIKKHQIKKQTKNKKYKNRRLRKKQYGGDDKMFSSNQPLYIKINEKLEILQRSIFKQYETKNFIYFKLYQEEYTDIDIAQEIENLYRNQFIHIDEVDKKKISDIITVNDIIQEIQNNYRIQFENTNIYKKFNEKKEVLKQDLYNNNNIIINIKSYDEIKKFLTDKRKFKTKYYKNYYNKLRKYTPNVDYKKNISIYLKSAVEELNDIIIIVNNIYFEIKYNILETIYQFTSNIKHQHQHQDQQILEILEYLESQKKEIFEYYKYYYEKKEKENLKKVKQIIFYLSKIYFHFKNNKDDEILIIESILLFNQDSDEIKLEKLINYYAKSIEELSYCIDIYFYIFGKYLNFLEEKEIYSKDSKNDANFKLFFNIIKKKINNFPKHQFTEDNIRDNIEASINTMKSLKEASINTMKSLKKDKITIEDKLYLKQLIEYFESKIKKIESKDPQ